ncbi:MAG: acyl-CoA reductase [Bacteroidota bacterium]
MIIRLADADTARAVTARVAAAAAPRPFATEITDFTTQLSATILGDPRSRPLPEVVALGYWLRPASTRRLAEHFAALDSGAGLRVPVGLSLHIPPANVDPIFAYSWLLALLCGNASLIRLPRRRGAVADLLLDQIGQVLPQHPAIAAMTCFLEYGHDDAITAALSAHAGIRVIWGGDETIRHIRAVPLPPRSKEIVFADRKSFAAIAAPAFLALDDEVASALMKRFALDVFLFDQMACSSVRLLAWCGSPAETAAAAGRAVPLLRQAAAERGFAVEPATALAKYAACQRLAMDVAVSHVDWGNGVLAVVELAPDGAPQWPQGDHSGGGLLLQTRVAALTDLIPIVDLHVQTMSQYGFSREDMVEFIRHINGRGLDRIVPLGSAMDFAPVWDGYDLLSEFTRTVTIG